MRQLTIQRVMLITLFALVFAIATRIPVDTDTWWHIRSGEYTLNDGMIYEDPFSNSKNGEEWINHSWGSQVVMYGIWQIAGNAGLALLTAALATGGMAVIYTLCAGNVYLRAFAVALGAMTAAVFWAARPQMASFFLSTVILWLLYRLKYDKLDRLWWLVPLMALWGNLHAGFSIAYILIFGFFAGEIAGNIFNRKGENVVPPAKLRKLALVTVVSIAALMINPYTYKMLLVPFQTVSIGALRQYIQEWNSPDFQQTQVWPFVLLLFAVFGAVGASKRRLDWTDFFLVSGTAFMGLIAGRNIAVFAVVAVPVLTFHVDAILDELGWVIRPITRVTKRQARLNAVLAGLVLLGVLAYIVSALNTEAVDEAQREFLPVQVAEFIAEEQPPGPMFNSYNWGGYLMFALPEYPVYVDGRTDLYKNDFLTRYLRMATAGDDWRENLDEDGINLVVVETGSGLAHALEEEAGWTQIYPTVALPDNGHVVFIRDEPLNS